MMGVEVIGLGVLISIAFVAPVLMHYGPGMKESWQEQTGKIPKGSSVLVARLNAEGNAHRSARNKLTMAFLFVVCLASLATFGTVDGVVRVLHGAIYLTYPDR